MTALPSFPLLEELVRDRRYLGMHDAAFEWWEVACTHVDAITSAGELAARVRVNPNTMISRCDRAGVPSPKAVLVALRLLRAGQLMAHGLKAADVAYVLHFAAPSTFRLHVRHRTGMSRAEYRQAFQWEPARECFLRTMYLPYRTLWRRYSPALAPRRMELAA